MKKNNNSVSLIDTIIYSLRKTKIKHRLLVTPIITTVIPIVIIVTLLISTALNLFMNEISKNNEQVMGIIEEDISDIFENYEAVSDEILWGSGMITKMANFDTLSNKETESLRNELDRIINNRTNYISDVVDFTVFNENADIIFNKSMQFIGYQFKINAIKSLDQNTNNSKWFQLNMNSGDYLSMVRPIKFQNKLYGYVFIAVKEKAFKKVYRNFHKESEGLAFLLNDKSIVISSNNEEKLPIRSSYNDMHVVKKESISKSSYKATIDGEKFIVNESSISGSGITLYGILPYSYFYSSFQSFHIQLLGIVSFVVILCIFASFLLYQSIMRPLRTIVNRINQLDKNNLHIMMVEDGKDEITSISKSVNKMSDSLRTSLQNIQIKEREKHEMELKMLQAQINPHFLFNTLGSIRYLALMSNAKVVANGVEALSNLLRNTILEKNEYITIEDEIKNIENYITIQKIRYGDGFSVTYQIEDEIKKFKILKFILQPIVENAILHAFDEKGELNNILIIGRYKEGSIIFEVCDNGVGIANEKLEDFEFDIEKFAGIGIKNIRDRIHLHYDDLGSFSIHSVENKGTIVTIKYPK